VKRILLISCMFIYLLNTCSFAASASFSHVSSISTVEDAANQKDLSVQAIYGTPVLIYLVLFVILSITAFYLITRSHFKTGQRYENYILYILLAAGFSIRIIVAPVIEGVPWDLSCFTAWSSSAAENLTGFYKTGLFCDYPPFYIYVLYIIGKIVSIFGLGDHYILMVKLPSIMADIATSYILYRIAKNHFSGGFALLAAFLYAFNPAVFMNSTLWGQVDSFFTLIILSALIALKKDRLYLSSVLMAAAVLMKPQGIFFLPVLLFDLVKRKSIKHFILSFVYGLAACILIILPFSSGQEPLWIFKLYFNTANGYPYASMNAFNLFGMFGANLRQDSLPFFILSYKTWGYIFDFIIFIFAGFLYYKGKHNALPFIVAVVLNSGAFIFSSRMHERYMFPVIALTLAALIYLKDKRLFHLFLCMTVVIFLNMHLVLYGVFTTDNPHIDPGEPVFILLSFINILTFGYLVKISIDTLIRGSAVPIFPGNASKVRSVKLKKPGR